ncbi:bifunctional RNase H/acid phosphatase [Nocardioides agariphilus]|uniref:Bifunctional RNase H/acid phosphatase n=1 Tax=Nocardioides agariphilus TaxID=433664 RepID=A0A930YNP6_9ACTN|nr:bifunctional RNase H/acid phosphatase [Nocardioides agariphilus]
MTRRVVIEADGGSRGNPGPAAYGAVLKDADTGEVIAEDGTAIGVASNNVAEYSGLIAGLKMAADLAPDADIEVRMDSRLVVEQMSGTWKIKHPDMKPLAIEANRLAPFGTTYTWIPREQNKHADRLVNEALDGLRSGVTVAVQEQGLPPTEAEDAGPEETEPSWLAWRRQVPTTLVLVRHGVTAHTRERRFSGGLASSNPGLSEEGREQIRMTADWLASISDRVDAVVASPVRRAHESAEILAEHLGVSIEEEPGFAEMEFGTWDGMTFDEVAAMDRAAVERWLGSLEERPGGGESLVMVQQRVLAALERVLSRHVGRTVVIASHVTPIKVVVAEALQVPVETQFRMELRPASVSVVTFFTPPEGETLPGATQRYASLRQLNMLAPGVDLFDDETRW